jgi:hypothetical protein
MKKNISLIKSQFSLEISRAKANSYEAIMLPFECEYDPYCLNNSDDQDHILDIANDFGWDKFLLIDFLDKSETFIDLFEFDAA